MKQLLRKMIFVVVLLPLTIGTIGYIIAGEMFTNALYASFALYFTNPISDSYNLYVEIARWSAPLVTATSILCALQSVWKAIKCWFSLLWKKDKVAIYSDEDCEIAFEKSVGVIYPGEKLKGYANNHIIMFSSDKKSLQFYEQHKNELDGKKIYMGLRDIEGSLVNRIEKTTLFDVNNTIARLLWKKIALWNNSKQSYDIVVWGDSVLAGNVVSVGLQLNLFSLNQNIRYHVVTDNQLFKSRHSELKLMNQDELCFYEKSNSEIWSIVSNADIVIVADEMEPELMQTMVIKSGESPLYYYSPKEGDLASYISYGNLIPFGRMDLVLTDENIRRKGLIQKAIALNEHYANKYGSEKEWDLLPGFLQFSNISASDFGEVLSVLDSEKSENELAELEHVRWCRFYYLNYYTLGTPGDGKNRDDIKRIHKNLVPYEDLTSEEKLKNIEAIRVVKNLYQ